MAVFLKSHPRAMDWLVEEDVDSSSSEIPGFLKKRTDSITRKVFEAMAEMGVPKEIASKVRVSFNLDKIAPSPDVRKKGSSFIVEIPFLFLLEAKDGSSEMGPKMGALIAKHLFTPRELTYLKAFSEFSQDPVMAEKAKKFVLYHEIAHILFQHFDEVDDDKSKDREMQADLTSAEVSHEAEGGIYLFNIMSKYDQAVSTTHPSFEERARYLREFQDVRSLTPSPDLI
ncbi:MAG: hypothetical protein NTX49_08655 [Chlamydiae bacterium]|nr:hypothetical protein [Chlamydiota bacterium]